MNTPLALAQLASQTFDPPATPLRGSLTLSGAQERMLIQLVTDRLSTSMGGYISSGWLEDRNVAMKEYEGDMSHRVKPGTIFAKSNLTLNIPKRYARINSARIFDRLLSSTNLLDIGPEGDDDKPEDAKVLERYAGQKFNEAKVRDVLKEAQMLACIRGETVVKTVWKRQERRFKRTATILLDHNGHIVRARDGNPCTSDEQWNDAADGVKVLARDPRIKISGNPTWFKMTTPFKHVIYDGLELACLDHRDFICNTTEHCIHAADFNAIRLDLEYDTIRTMLAPLANTPEAIRFLQRLETGESTGPRAESNLPNEFRGESDRDRDAMPKYPFAEVYLRVIIDPDGMADEICMLVDLTNDQILAYDYLDNISPTGFRPQRVVRVEPVPMRWFGTGMRKLFADRHKFADLFLNRVNFAAGMSGNLKFENPRATIEGQAGEPIEFGTDKTYQLVDGYKAEDAFSILPVPNDAGPSKELMDLTLQVTALEGGMVSAGDSSLGGLPASSLATGIKSLEEVADVLLKVTIYDAKGGLEEVIGDAVTVLLARFDKADALRLMGEKDAAILEKFRNLKHLPYKVKINLTAAKDAEIVANNERVFGTITNYLTQPPEAQVILYPILVEILTALGIDTVSQLPKPQLITNGQPTDSAGQPNQPALEGPSRGPEPRQLPAQ